MFILGSLESAYVLDFILVLIELPSLGVPAESLRVKRYGKSTISLEHGQFDKKI